jgi:hypothetical protein
MSFNVSDGSAAHNGKAVKQNTQKQKRGDCKKQRR